MDTHHAAPEEALAGLPDPAFSLYATNKEGRLSTVLEESVASLFSMYGAYSDKPNAKVEYVAVDWPSDEGMAQVYDPRRMHTPDEHASARIVDDQDDVNLQQCIEGFLREEPLGPEDMWFCPRCKEDQQALKKLELWRMPQVLVVHLKRFSYSRVWRDKLDTKVDFPFEDLDLSTYVKNSDGRKMVYDLFAVSNHYGGLGGGHYTAFAKQQDDGRWYLFDDSHVTKADEGSIVSSASYVLFYELKEASTAAGADGDIAMSNGDLW
ncbi:hypothetical protein CYMTET_19939 [Cymbomonas tetramitiformis]|uniref:ubiquitinyl hydrolase 1 n=1 Tax=Cymbomonas tetramitiformis TaxID=36881 RepID=A0AAE0G5L5_9CHLO|nr:hypothetical protein CYMTET_19939 [Cymbomonas tetramitiformis]